MLAVFLLLTKKKKCFLFILNKVEIKYIYMLDEKCQNTATNRKISWRPKINKT